MTDTTTPRIVRLQANTTGAWRNVLDFDVDQEEHILHHAPALFGHARHIGTLRIVVPGEAGWLAHWESGDGWRDHDGNAI